MTIERKTEAVLYNEHAFNGHAEFRFRSESLAVRDNLQLVIVESHYSSARVWLDTYGDTREGSRVSTYSWISADDAEEIAYALLLAAKISRENSAKIKD